MTNASAPSRRGRLFDGAGVTFPPNKRSRSRDAVFCTRGLRHGTDKRRRARSRHAEVLLRPGGRTGFGSITLGASSPDGAKRYPGAILQASLSTPGFASLTRATKKRRIIKTREAERRQTPPTKSAPYGCGARPAGRAAPTGVPPRFLRQRTNAAAQLQTRFLGRG